MGHYVEEQDVSCKVEEGVDEEELSDLLIVDTAGEAEGGEHNKELLLRGTSEGEEGRPPEHHGDDGVVCPKDYDTKLDTIDKDFLFPGLFRKESGSSGSTLMTWLPLPAYQKIMVAALLTRCMSMY